MEIIPIILVLLIAYILIFHRDEILFGLGMAPFNNYSELAASKMREIAGINANFSIRIEDSFEKCWNETYCLTTNETVAYESLSGINTGGRVDAYSDWAEKEIVIQTEHRNDIPLIAHEVAHMKLFDERLYSTEFHHDQEDFKCFENCLYVSYVSGINICGGCGA